MLNHSKKIKPEANQVELDTIFPTATDMLEIPIQPWPTIELKEIFKK